LEELSTSKKNKRGAKHEERISSQAEGEEGGVESGRAKELFRLETKVGKKETIITQGGVEV